MIVSDCGSNFKGADTEMKAALIELHQNQSAIGTYCAEKEIEWRFIPPESPHMGGAWERLVGSVKRPLRSMLGYRLVDDFELITMFTEAENIVNSRPLTPVSDNVDDLEALTPNHFLLGRVNVSLPISETFELHIPSRRRLRRVQSLAKHFWTRWRKEYLPSKTTRPKWNKEQRNMRIGDLVLLVERDGSRWIELG